MPDQRREPQEPRGSDNGYRPPALKLSPIPGTRKEAAKEAAIDAVYNVRAILTELVDDFRSSDRFFKYKAGILSGWLVLSLLTLVLACPSAQQTAGNVLRAKVEVMQVTGLEAARTTFLIENQSNAAWNDVLLKLNGSWTAAIPSIDARQRAIVELRKFSAADGRSPPIDLRPTTLEIRSGAGSALIALEKK